MSDLCLLALHRLFLNRAGELRALLARTGDPVAATEEIPPGELDAVMSQAEADAGWLDQPGHHLIDISAADYPSALKEIYDPPCLLFASGDASLLKKPQNRVAIVGSRKASAYGLKQAGRIAGDICGHDIAVVSGLALGIDAAAHEGTLAAGGVTIAVLGTGPDQVYPRRHWRLAERIRQSGLLISEFPPGIPAFPANFPSRNRIVTGLSRATVVVEAATGSGSLISARLALSEGRDVMAVPGLVTNRQARGCHRLIRDGATLVESGADVLKELGIDGELTLQLGGGLEAGQLALLDVLSQGPQSIDMLMAAVPLTVEELTVNLVSLEVQGLIVSEAGAFQLARVTGIES